MRKWIPPQVPDEVAHDVKTIREEVANMLSHGLGIVLFLCLSPYLIYVAYHSQNQWYLAGCTIFCISLLMVYTSSTLYHSMYKEKRRRYMRIFDHISIYYLIAGSYTPFIFTHFQDSRGWLILSILWSMAIIGSFFKLFYTDRFKLLSTLAYLVMGWMVIWIIEPLMNAVPPTCFMYIALGGVFYTLGVIFYLWEKLYHNHFIWHLFVLGGSVAHFIAVLYCI